MECFTAERLQCNLVLCMLSSLTQGINSKEISMSDRRMPRPCHLPPLVLPEQRKEPFCWDCCFWHIVRLQNEKINSFKLQSCKYYCSCWRVTSKESVLEQVAARITSFFSLAPLLYLINYQWLQNIVDYIAVCKSNLLDLSTFLNSHSCTCNGFGQNCPQILYSPSCYFSSASPPPPQLLPVVWQP